MEERSVGRGGWTQGSGPEGSRVRGVIATSLVAGSLLACGGGSPPAPRDAAGEAPDAETSVDVGGRADAPTTTSCSAESPAACAYVPEGSYAELAPITREVTYTDALGEDRTIEVTLWRPDGAPRPWPVVLWSHGGALGISSSLRVGDGWRGVFVGAGYAFVGIAHRPRSDDSRGRLCAHFGITDIAECARVKYLHYDRPRDVAAVLDFLEAESVGPLAGFLDLEHVLHAGHSAGSGGGSLLAGATRDLFGMPQMAPDPRPLAFIGASMEGVGDDGFTDTSFDAITRPHLTLSGEGDSTPEAMAAWRRLPFERMAPGDKFRLWITDADARHGTFDHDVAACEDFRTARGVPTAGCELHLAWLESSALAFADAYLRDRAEAHAWLASDAIVTMSGGVVEWSRR